MCRFFFFTLLLTVAAPAKDVVVLLHGLARSSKSMTKMEKTLEKNGYQVINLDYPSRKHSIENLSLRVFNEIKKETKGATKIHFVTHSLGGILLRHIRSHQPIKNLGRVVMLSPPNQGSEIVDSLGHWTLFQWLNGPAGSELGTQKESTPLKLGPVDFELAVITGDRSVNWILSALIPGKDDGKVSVERAQVKGMNHFKVVHASHPFIMKKEKVIAEVLSFLKTGALLE